VILTCVVELAAVVSEVAGAAETRVTVNLHATYEKDMTYSILLEAIKDAAVLWTLKGQCHEIDICLKV
jgi:hypothetical protein